MRVVSAVILGLVLAVFAVAGENANKKPQSDVQGLIARGQVARESGQYQLAIDLYAQAARAIEQNEGPESIALINVWTQQGVLLQYQGQIAAANAVFEKAIALAARHPEADAESVAAAFDAAALAAVDKGDKAAAAQALERALALRRAARPQKATEIARNLFRLAATYRQQGRLHGIAPAVRRGAGAERSRRRPRTAAASRRFKASTHCSTTISVTTVAPSSCSTRRWPYGCARPAPTHPRRFRAAAARRGL